MRKQLYILVALLMLCIAKGYAQDAVQDTMWMVRMKEVNVTAQRKWLNDTAQYRYNQMRHYVKTILPYLNEATVLFTDINQKINDPNISRKERKAYINSKEDLLRTKFDNEIKKLNETQGILLMKLIGRQTGVNIYQMLQEFKNPLTAVKWQAYARFNGLNINKKYNPEEEPLLEHIMEGLGYPLPVAIYGEREIPAVKNF